MTAVDLPAYRRRRRQMLRTLLVFALLAAVAWPVALMVELFVQRTSKVFINLKILAKLGSLSKAGLY